MITTSYTTETEGLLNIYISELENNKNTPPSPVVHLEFDTKENADNGLTLSLIE